MSDYFDSNNEELLKDFFVEANSQVDLLEQNILVLENDPTNRDSVDEIFRAAHTLKGGAATVEMTELAEFTHLVEDVLDEIRSDKIKVTGEVVDLLLKAIDVIKAMLAERASGGVYDGDVGDLKHALSGLLAGDNVKDTSVVKANAPAAVSRSPQSQSQVPSPSEGLTEYEVLEIREASAKSKHVFRVIIAFNVENVMKTVSAIHVFAALRDVGTILKTHPDFEKLYEDHFWPTVDYYLATDKTAEDVHRKALIPEVTSSASIIQLHFDELGHMTQNMVMGGSAEGGQEAPAKLVPTKPSSSAVSAEEFEAARSAAEARDRASKQATVAKPAVGNVQPAVRNVQPAVGNVQPATVAAPKTQGAAQQMQGAAQQTQGAAQQTQGAAPKMQGAASVSSEVQAAPIAMSTENDGDEPEGKAADGRKMTQQTGSILRVDSRRIDNLLNLVSETVINKATFNQISTQFSEIQLALQAAQIKYRDDLKELFDCLPDYLQAIQQGHPIKEVKKEILEKYGGLYASFDTFEQEFKNNVAKFRSTAQNLGRITGELQEGVMRIRMVPISQIFSRFPRLIRDLSKNLNKKVNLVIEGEDTELDKSVIEDLLDPLMHSVRNALDHGVESPEDRRAAGKPEEGTVLLKASNEGNMIIIEIGDDGKGISVEAVKKKAVERGLIHPSKVLTEVEAFNLIFEPGFSTAEKITNISGRGVGLDVVKRQIEKLNGTVTVSSQRGKGTRFIIKLPLTLAIIQGLLVRVGREIYSIPITSVIESHRIKPSEIKMIDGYEVFNVRNDVVSLLRLNRLFRIMTDETRDYHFVVIVGTNEKRVGLIVDSLIGEEDVVIKPLRDQFTNSPGIAGASILGDGSVCLIIDVSQLLDLGLKRELEERAKLEMTIR